MNQRSIRVPLSKIAVSLTVSATVLAAGCGSKKDDGAGASGGTAPAAAAATGDQIAIAGDIYFKSADGTVKVWGWGSVLGDNPDDQDRTKPTVVADLAKTKSLATGGGQTMCAVMMDGSAKCWGNGASGELGDGKEDSKSDKPVVVQGLTNVASIGIGSYFLCALIGDGTVKCWGSNSFHEASVEEKAKVLTPTTVPDVAGATQIAVSGEGTCALSSDGSVKCWGLSCGAPGPGLCVKPYAVAGFAGATRIAAGRESTCAIVKDTVQCFGSSNEYGQMGTGTTDDPTTGQIYTVKGLSGVRDLASGADHTCALMNDGTVQCWGSNEYGQLGDGQAPDAQKFRATPAPVKGLTGAVSLACGSSGTCCAQLADKSLKCWGENSSGALFGEANKDSEAVATPVAVAL